jgi:hypothetical protein
MVTMELVFWVPSLPWSEWGDESKAAASLADVFQVSVDLGWCKAWYSHP